jgi:hypothetical protein
MSIGSAACRCVSSAVLCCWRQACEHCCSFVLCDMALCGCQRKMEEEIETRRKQEEKDRQLAVLWSDSHAPYRSASLHPPVPSRLYSPGQMVPSICVQAHASRRHVYAKNKKTHTHMRTHRPADSFTSSLIPTFCVRGRTHNVIIFTLWCVHARCRQLRARHGVGSVQRHARQLLTEHTCTCRGGSKRRKASHASSSDAT